MQTIQNATMVIKEAIGYQSPIIGTWLLASSVSLVVMFAVLCLA